MEDHRVQLGLRDATLAGHIPERDPHRDRRRLHYGARHRLRGGPRFLPPPRQQHPDRTGCRHTAGSGGLEPQLQPQNVYFQSPDRLAEVYLRQNHRDHTAEMRGHQERWLTLAGPPGNQWYATASSFTRRGW
ncbi:hypothetical protein NKH18_07080 [Streptomyces sp. M10(2022)]